MFGMRTARVSLIGLVLGLTVTFLAGCEEQIGSYCDADKAFVNQRVDQNPEYDSLAVDVNFNNCDFFCTSTGGSRPYCTKPCNSQNDCQGNFNETWDCAPIIRYSRFGCEDWSESRDCLDAEESDFKQYCRATPSVIEARDEQYGRSWDDNADDGMSMTDGGT